MGYCFITLKGRMIQSQIQSALSICFTFLYFAIADELSENALNFDEQKVITLGPPRNGAVRALFDEVPKTDSIQASVDDTLQSINDIEAYDDKFVEMKEEEPLFIPEAYRKKPKPLAPNGERGESSGPILLPSGRGPSMTPSKGSGSTATKHPLTFQRQPFSSQQEFRRTLVAQPQNAPRTGEFRPPTISSDNSLRTGVCRASIFYISTPMYRASHHSFSHFALTVSADQCARTCHEFNCAIAHYNPSNGRCQFNPSTSFAIRDGQCPQWPSPHYRNNMVPTTATRIFCVQCHRPYRRTVLRSIGGRSAFSANGLRTGFTGRFPRVLRGTALFKSRMSDHNNQTMLANSTSVRVS